MEEARADDYRLLRSVAAARVRTESLQRWWCKKHNRPRKDPLLLEYTPEELMIEYLEDLIENDPAEEFPEDVRDSGLYGHRTGDPLIDQWQEDAALGKPIDFGAAFGDPEARAAFEAIKAASRARHEARHGRPAVPDVHDDYADIADITPSTDSSSPKTRITVTDG